MMGMISVMKGELDYCLIHFIILGKTTRSSVPPFQTYANRQLVPF